MPDQGLSASSLLAVKEEIRQQIWTRLTASGIARPPLPLFGRIPNFAGAGQAAERLSQLPAIKEWHMVFCNPDSPQRPVRYHLLEAGKLLVMATPKLRKGFLLIDPTLIPQDKLSEAATIRGAFRLGSLILEPPQKIDAKIMGSVAVDTYGGRIGKGGGYSDLEYAILTEVGAVTPKTPTITTVHDLQIVTDQLPMTPLDTPIDIIVTSTRLIRTNTKYARPRGIEWSLLSEKRRTEITWPPSIKIPSSV